MIPTQTLISLRVTPNLAHLITRRLINTEFFTVHCSQNGLPQCIIELSR